MSFRRRGPARYHCEYRLGWGERYPSLPRATRSCWSCVPTIGAQQRNGCQMRFLITGGAGFIGSHLAERLLAGGHRVHILDDLST